MKILVADDDPVSRRMMQGVLQRSGYEVVVAEDGVAAFQELSTPDGPRLALIDWMMPGLDGPGVCRAVRMRKDEAYIYLVLLTSKDSSEDIVLGLEAGADDYLTKPCHAAELRARLSTGRRILRLEDKLIEAREAMRIRATRDGLTKLWNRTAILGHLQESMNRIMEGDGAVSLLLCDVDHFKQINDRHGHQAGDEVLVELAQRLRGSVRSGDFVGRYGGEEFLIVLNGCSGDSLVRRAEQLRSRVVEMPFQTCVGPLDVSISVGATEISNTAQNPTLEHFVKRADDLLYQAKRSGRNRVCLADNSVPAEEVITSAA